MIIYDSLSRSYKELMPIVDNKINLFVCGQTVYDDAHIGHAKLYTNFSVIVRWLRYLKYDVVYIQNITDVDDKIIKRATETHRDPIEHARFYEKRLMEDMKSLGNNDVNMFPRSHDYIKEIKMQIQKLIDRGYAYVIDNDVYYNVKKFNDYTKLSGISLDELDRHRIEPNPKKINSYDFSLWKGAKENEPAWSIDLLVNGKVIFVKGRPGWHIEDTAITESIFGPQYDIHGGAKELIFPHHTNEIAQEEAASGKSPMVRYWMHSGVTKLNGEKMSKSLKNFITIREVLKKYHPEVIRLMIESTHYTKDIDHRDVIMEEATAKLREMYITLSLFYNNKNIDMQNSKSYVELESHLKEFEIQFKDAMNDDFNTPLAITALYSLIKYIKSFIESENSITISERDTVMKRINELSHIIGILDMDYYKKELPDTAEELIEKRTKFRKGNDFTSSDKIREELSKKFCIGIQDLKDKTLWYWIPQI